MKTKKATDKQLLERCLRTTTDVAAWMGLTPQWHIGVMLDTLTREGAPNAAGQVQWPVLYKKAIVYYDRETVRKSTDAELLEIVTHEMIHILFAPTEDMLREQVGRNSYTMMRFIDTQEGVCDSITHLILKALGEGRGPVFSRTKAP